MYLYVYAYMVEMDSRATRWIHMSTHICTHTYPYARENLFCWIINNNNNSEICTYCWHVEYWPNDNDYDIYICEHFWKWNDCAVIEFWACLYISIDLGNVTNGRFILFIYFVFFLWLNIGQWINQSLIYGLIFFISIVISYIYWMQDIPFKKFNWFNRLLTVEW